MPPALLADITVTVHALFMGFIVLGQLLIFVGWLRGWQWVRSPWFRGAHLLAIAIVVGQILAGVPCPLTVWEYDWRQAAGLEWTTRDGWSAIGAFFHNLVIFDNVRFDHWAFQLGYISFGLVMVLTLVLAASAVSPPPGVSTVNYEALADIILVTHFAYMSFVVFGQLLILVGWALRWQWVRNFWFRAAHLLAIVLVIIRSLFFEWCPLTTWEITLRQWDHQSWEASTPAMRHLQTAIGYDLGQPAGVFFVAYAIFALLVLATLVAIPPRWRKRFEPAIASQLDTSFRAKR